MSETAERITMTELAEVVGVTKQRIHKVKDDKRIVGLERGPGGRSFAPKNPRILRGDRERPGPLTDYIASWEADNGVTAEENTVEAFNQNGHA